MLVENKLTESELKAGVAVTVAVHFLIGLFLVTNGRPLAPGLILVSLALLWLYSFPLSGFRIAAGVNSCRWPASG